MEDDSQILMNREELSIDSSPASPFFLIFSIRERCAGVCVCVCVYATELSSKDLTRPSGRDPFSDLTECSIKMKPRKRHNREPKPNLSFGSGAYLSSIEMSYRRI